MFEIGKVYNRQDDIHKIYGGKIQSGIAPSAKTLNVFLFSSPEGELYGYQDGWTSDHTFFQYTGEGQRGDQEFKRGNYAILKHKEQGRHLHLFEKSEPSYFTYLGEFKYNHNEIVMGEDIDHKIRKMILFYLKKLEQ